MTELRKRREACNWGVPARWRLWGANYDSFASLKGLLAMLLLIPSVSFFPGAVLKMLRGPSAKEEKEVESLARFESKSFVVPVSVYLFL